MAKAVALREYNSGNQSGSTSAPVPVGMG